nr:hypothetical protein [Bacteroidota bacterium]
MMSKFIRTLLSFIAIVAIPFCILVGLYFYFDPFMVVRHYTNFSHSHVALNRDYVSSQIFLQNYPKHKFDSYIFGSSRTMAFEPNVWKTKLEADARPFMFDAAAESIYGIHSKIKYLDDHNIPIRNALIIVCHDRTFEHSIDEAGFLFIKHYKFSDNGFINFHKTFFLAYLDPHFLKAYFAYQNKKKYEKWMAKYMVEWDIEYDTVNNQMFYYKDIEKQLLTDPDAYYNTRMKNFFAPQKKETIDSKNLITASQIKMMKEIIAIFEKNKTKYKVVVSPLYTKVKFSHGDTKVLQSIFGKQFYDFSGDNIYTSTKYNYYEMSHYRKTVGRQIMDSIYHP